MALKKKIFLWFVPSPITFSTPSNTSCTDSTFKPSWRWNYVYVTHSQIGLLSFSPSNRTKAKKIKSSYSYFFPSNVWFWFLFFLITHWGWQFLESELYVGIFFWPMTNKIKYLDQQVLTDAKGHCQPQDSLFLLT